jgi:hypothetical protein
VMTKRQRRESARPPRRALGVRHLDAVKNNRDLVVR